MTKTYALLDVIGIKRAFAEANATERLRRFWEETEAWTNGRGNDPSRYLPVLGCPGVCQAPSVYVVTYSDSAVMHTEPEVELEDFYSLACDLKEAIQRAVSPVYCIVSRGDEVPAPQHPVTGGYHFAGTNMRPLYANIAGSGAAWVDLYLADQAVRRRKDWHGLYALYAVGDDSRPRLMPAKGSEPFQRFDAGPGEVLALE